MRYHLAISVEGALRNMSDCELRGMFKFDGGAPMTPHQARQSLKLELHRGRKVIPCTPCDNFDYQTGCKGHDD